MTETSTNPFELDFTFDEFDPLEDRAADELIIPDEILDTDGLAIAAKLEAEKPKRVDTRTPLERTNDLLAAMDSRRGILLGIMRFCLEAQPVAAVNSHIDALQKSNYSVYTSANLCALLEQAGAIERVDTAGQPIPDVPTEPQVVVIDGVEYLEVCDPVEAYWLTTQTGRAVLDTDKPADRLRELFAEDAKYAEIYQRILLLCAEPSGAAIPRINQAVDHDPLVQRPRLYAPFFVEKLKKCDALVWDQTWHVTELGKTALELLDAMIAAPKAQNGEN